MEDTLTITPSSYVVYLALTEPDGYTWQTGGPGAYTAPPAGEYAAPVAPPATGVKPIGSLALQLIQWGVTPAEAKYLRLDAHGLLNKTLLHQGAQALAPVGGNYQALLAITDSGKTVEVIMGKAVETRTTLKPEVMGTVEYLNELDSMWELEKTAWIKEGGNFETYKAKHPQFTQEGMWSGMGGITLVPDKPGGHGRAKGNIMQVVINTHYASSDSTMIHKHMASTLAHEMYGHALFEIQGKRWEHGRNEAPGPGSDYNAPLQNQIKQRTHEAEQNFDRHPH